MERERLVVALVVLGACGPAEHEPPWSAPPPNVLLVSIDTLRADHLGFHGYWRDTSPNLDALAARAAVFDHAQASSSWTLPTLATVLTSHYSSTHGCWTFTSRLDPSHTTLAEHLLAHGYDTASISSAVYLGMDHGLQQGIVHFDDSAYRPDVEPSRAVTSERISAAAVRFLEAKADSPDELPWLLWLHYFDPHDDFVFHPGFSERFSTTDATDPLQSLRDLYDGEIRWTDFHVGRVLDALERTGLARETLVVVLSDHGEELGDHGGTFHGHTLFDELTRVPLVIAGPGIEPRVVPDLVRTVDVLPTLLELVGCAVPDGLAGRSLVPLLDGAGLAERPAVAELRLRASAPLRSIVSGRWKLVIDLAAEPPTPSLYDRVADPGERRDVAADHPDVVRALTAELERTLAQAEAAAARYGRSPERVPGAEELDALRDLGYAEGER